MKVLCVALLAFSALAGASSRAHAQSANPRAACGPGGVSFRVTLEGSSLQPSTTAPGKTMVYFIQDAGSNAGIGYPTTRLGIDGAWVGANKESSWFAVPVDPGEHHLCVMVQSSLVDNSVELAHFTAEPGHSYYFRTRLLLARGLEYLELTPIDSDQGRYLTTSLPFSTAKPKK